MHTTNLFTEVPWSLLPLMAIQASFFLLCAASCSGVTSRSTPPTPVRSTPELPSLTQSMREWPGFRPTLLRGLPAMTHWRVDRRNHAGEKMSRQPLDQVPSVPWDLGDILEQHPHHGITQIDMARLLTFAGCLLSDCIRCTPPCTSVTIIPTVFMALFHIVTTLFLTVARIRMLQHRSFSHHLLICRHYVRIRLRTTSPQSMTVSAGKNSSSVNTAFTNSAAHQPLSVPPAVHNRPWHIIFSSHPWLLYLRSGGKISHSSLTTKFSISEWFAYLFPSLTGVTTTRLT